MTLQRSVCWTLTVLLPSLLVGSALADDWDIIDPTDDTFVSSNFPDGNYGNHSFMLTGDDRPSPNNYGVTKVFLRFDLSMIPPGSFITEASLYLYDNGNCGPSGQTVQVAAHTVTEDWSESDPVTWVDQPPYYSWPGTSHQDYCGGGGAETWDLTGEVDIWFYEGHDWYSCVLLIEDISPPEWRGYYSSEWGTVFERPKMHLHWETPPSACCVGPICHVVNSEDECTTLGGEWYPYESCSPNPCPQPEAACCVGETCTISTEADCLGANGVWHPEWIFCAPNPCPTTPPEVCDDMETDLWTFGHTNPNYDGTWVAGYSEGEAHSVVRSIRTSLHNGGTGGQDADNAYATLTVPFAGGNPIGSLSVWYNSMDISQTGGTNMAACCVQVSALDAFDETLDTQIYCVLAYDTYQGSWENMASWIYQEGRPAEYQPGAPDYSRQGDGSLIPPEGWWYKLEVSPADDLDVNWYEVAQLEFELVTRGVFMFGDTHGMYWDDFCYAGDASADVDPVRTLDSQVPPMLSMPNPFQEETTIRFVLAEDRRVNLGVWDVSGRLVRTIVDRHYPAARHSAVWDGCDGAGTVVPGGVYYVRLDTGDRIQLTRVIRTR